MYGYKRMQDDDAALIDSLDVADLRGGAQTNVARC